MSLNKDPNPNQNLTGSWTISDLTLKKIMILIWIQIINLWIYDPNRWLALFFFIWSRFLKCYVSSMVLILWWKEISAHVRSNIFYLICLRHLIRSRAVANRIFSSKKSSKGSNVGFIYGRLPSRVTVLSRIVHLYTVQPLLGYFVYTYISLHEKREVLFNIQRKK